MINAARSTARRPTVPATWAAAALGATLPAALALLLAVGVAWLAARRGDPR